MQGGAEGGTLGVIWLLRTSPRRGRQTLTMLYRPLRGLAGVADLEPRARWRFAPGYILAPASQAYELASYIIVSPASQAH